MPTRHFRLETFSLAPLLMLPGLAALALLGACGGVSDEVPPGDFERAVIEWQLVFSDEFDGTGLDTSKWNVQMGDGTDEGNPGWGNNELQSYSPDNISVANGVLTIQAREDAPGVYTSGRINSKNKFDFTYGRIEIGARLPAGQGMWPAAWMLSTEELYGPWPASGEIDIMEAFNPGNGNNEVLGAINFGLSDNPADRATLGSSFDVGQSPDLGIHVYEIEWEKGQIRYFVDGQHFQTIKSDNWYAFFKAGTDGFYDENGVYKLGLEAAPFDQQFHLLLNLAVGGDPVGGPDENTVFPQNYEIDYVRVYQCANANPDTGRGCGRGDPSVVPLVNDDPLKTISLDIYKDGPEVVEVSLGQEQATNTLQVGEFNGNGSVLINDPLAIDPDDATNTVWRVSIAGSGGVGNVFLGSEEFAEGSLLETGFDLRNADIAGQLVFDMFVNSISGTTILVKMDSGFPNGGEVALPAPVLGEWQTFAIDIADLVANPTEGGSGVDLETVLNLFVFEVFDGDVDVLIDNIRFEVGCKTSSDCRAQPKGSPEDVIVFDDAVGELWIGGIEGFDTDAGGDYRDGQTANKVNWEIKTLEDEPERGNIIEVVFKDNSASGVWFISSNPQVGVAGATDLTGYAQGALVFDIRVVDYDTASGITMKVDCDFSDNQCGSGDQILGRIADGVWETITIPVSQLVQGGLNLTKVNTGIVVFPGFAPVGITFQLDNVRWTLTGDIPEPTLDQIDLPVTFDDQFTDYTLVDFGGAVTELIADPDDAENTVAFTTNTDTEEVMAGTIIGNQTFANPIPFTMSETSMSADVRVGNLAGTPVRLKVETADCPSDGSDTTCFAELDAFPLMTDTWETLTWDFSLAGIDTTKTFEKASIFFNFGSPGNVAASYYWDNVRFGAPPPPPAPTIALSNGGFESGDFTDWQGTGDNTVGAPGVGAFEGAFAAQLTTMGGAGVSEVSQTFLASPGDEVNLSASMLTEAALPAGSTFGLAKIVFQDADGNDLDPASASIGTLITGEFAGIESAPLNDASPVDTWIFSEAQGVAPAGTTQVKFILLNVDFAGGENPMWFDDAQASLIPSVELANAGFEDGNFTGWDGTGDNVVGAPGIGALSGAFAAQLTSMGGAGVAEVSQTFPLNPGDEVNFSAWMLTEAALPAGSTFGLAKIVFQDADGNDLDPASASIGTLITGEFAGVESTPMLNADSPVNTWIFTEAQGVAPAGTVQAKFILLNVDFAGGENPMWFDDAQASVIGGEPPPPPPPPPPALALGNGGFETGDFTDWTGTGDNTVGAPGVGAQAGSFAAQLTTMDGAGVAEISQTFSASEGDEINFSAYMLTEMALPTGATFGLAKIVFQDAGGVDLVPASASIGTLNTDNPGVDSVPLLDDASAVDTWIFTEAQGVAPAGTSQVKLLLLNVDFAGGENPMWFDSAQASLVEGEPPPPPVSAFSNGGFETGDFTDWDGTGDISVAAPGVGANSGSFAALMNNPTGDGVAELSQTFAASPGDEVNLSVWMLTEAALPPAGTGATFGLAKIVFQDASGMDLIPESASIGVINTANPGIESQPFLNGDSAVNTWIFSEAQGVAPAGTTQVKFILLNVDFGNGANHPMWFDDAQASLVTTEPPPELALSNAGFESGDFTGWDGSGDISVAAPGVGANSGSFAALMNNPTGDGVAELSQTFAASPGDEVNLSVWMLTEAALPPAGTGATFGLAKIVFQDAGGMDLIPESASIGIINTANPGIESTPFLDGDSAVNTWVFSEAQGVAPAGTTQVKFILLNVDFGNGANHPMWFDDAQALLVPPNALANAGFETGDIAGWDGAGDISVGAPGAGANSGSFAALMNNPTGDGVAELSQTFAASPGDEVNLSVWMLTEAALPPAGTGATFGLAKIVFQDASGMDLIPESASIGVINTANPGIESQPFLNGDSAVNTWIFSEAQGVAPAGTTQVKFILLNVDFGNGANHPMWFDDAQASLVTAGGPGPMLNQVDLPVTFDDPGVDYDLRDFGDPVSALTMLNADPVEMGNMVAMTTKQMGAPFWAGTTVGDTNGLASPIPLTATDTFMSVRVYSPAAGIIVRLKVEDKTDPTKSVETDATTTAANTWETLTFNFANEAPGTAALDPSFTYDKFSIFFDFVLDKDGDGSVYYWDDVQFGAPAPPPPEAIALSNAGFEAGDFTGWDGTGDISVAAPGVGANSGSFAALMNNPTGDGVAEVSQTFAASPGDEVNLSVWMLTEAALPPAGTGATFGLAKIVFQDAGGMDLIPESASIGVINTANPGIESQPFLNGDSAVNTWIFSEAQGVAPAGTTQVKFILLNVDFGNGANHPMWFDDAQASLVTAEPPPELALSNAGFESGDFTGWDGTGDISVAAPGVGANSGSFAALMNNPTGDGVAEVSQTFAASPGDEVNLSVWMLTEAALPPAGTGATFGLAKIVFQDAGGMDLIPESASIGIINTANPGIESQPFLNGDSAVNTWIFSEAQGVAPAGTVQVKFILLNVDFGNGANHPMWFDDAQASLVPPNALANAGFEAGDFTGWDGTGDISVAAPGVGANSGSFAALMNNPTGDGVAEVSQTFAASPGDEVNLSVWMLTEAALPPAGTGATFGLAKIVFQDAGGMDLIPESASIGIINTANPGIESQPFLNGDSAVNTWIFSEAQGVAPAGTTQVKFILLNVDFGNGANHPMWFDDAAATLVGGGP